MGGVGDAIDGMGDATSSGSGSPMETDGHEALRTLSDKPLEDDAGDRLDFVAYADALGELLDHPDTDTPLTIAISAQWGAGKTSLAKMLEARLRRRPIQRGDPPHVTCWFNAWMHDDAPHLGAAFAADVAKTADHYRPVWRRVISPLPSAMLSPQERWKRRLKIALASFIIALTITLLPGPGGVLRDVFAPKADVVNRLQESFGAARVGLAILALVVFAFCRKVFAAAQAAARFVDDPKSEAARGSMQDVSAQLGQLIEQARHVRRQWFLFIRPARRFVIFVDDLERCRPPRAVEVCEVASQLLGHPGVITVLIADMGTIAASAEMKYSKHVRVAGAKGSASGWPPGVFGRLYLQKIVQIQFNLPPSPIEKMPDLLKDSGVNRSGKSEVVQPSRTMLEKVPTGVLIGFVPGFFVSIYYTPTISVALGAQASATHELTLINFLIWLPLWIVISLVLAVAISIPLAIREDYLAHRARRKRLIIDKRIRDEITTSPS